MPAYAETYMPNAQKTLGGMLDFAVHGCGVPLSTFYGQFLESTYAQRLEQGEPAVIVGRSGEEIVLDILEENETGFPSNIDWPPSYVATPEYWTGWALAFYQWASGRSFANINAWAPINNICALYAPYHEMDPRQFCDYMENLAHTTHPQTKLQLRRQAAHLSQSQLAKMAGVPVRTLQQYEQRQKNINHARADYVCMLAQALCCKPHDLLEPNLDASYEYAIVDFS